MSKIVDFEFEKDEEGNSTGFSYHTKDKQAKNADYIRLSAPTMKHLKERTEVKEIVFRAFKRIGQSVDKLPDADEAQERLDDAGNFEDGDALIMSLVMNCDPGEMSKLYLYMQDLLTSGVAYIDGKDVKLNKAHLEKMELGEFERLCGEYIGNFIAG